MSGAGVAAPPSSLGALAERYGGVVDEPARPLLVRRIAPLEEARGADDLCPLTARRHLPSARVSPCLLLVDASLAPLVPAGRRWVHPYAGWALAGILADLDTTPPIDRRDRAMIDPDARIDGSARIGEGAVIMAGSCIGAGSVIEPNAVIYPRVTLGARVLVGACAVIGRPGFGFAHGPEGALRRIPQLGGVQVEDDVEIGPLATVDAGTLSPTVLGRGARLDAHVHVGHNVKVGAGTMVAAQSGFAGSVNVGEGVRIGGQAGFADHVRVGKGAQIAAKAGVIGDIREGTVVAGYPAIERARWLRGMARMFRASGKRK